MKGNKMKKSYIKTGLLLITSFIFFGCNDDFLDRYPLDMVSNDTYWSSEYDLRVYNNYLYTEAGNYLNTGILWGHGDGLITGNVSRCVNQWMLDAMSDNIVAVNLETYGFLLDIRAGIHTVPTGDSWNPGEEYRGYFGWSLVRAINIGLANYNKAQISQDVIDMYTAEARLLRGWFYADKVQKFGDVAWIDKELNVDSEELYAPRTPREDVMEKVIADLEFACQYLPDDWGDGNAPGRLNRWAALAVTSRLCLFEGTWRKYHGGTDPSYWLNKAADAAKELIEQGPYRLYSTGDPEHDYGAPTYVLNDLTGNSEVIYWRKYIYGIAMNNVKMRTVGVTKSLVEDYLCTDGLPITLSPLYKGDEVYLDLFIDRDPRLKQTVLYPPDRGYLNYGTTDLYPYPRLIGMSMGHRNPSGYHLIKGYNVTSQTMGWNQQETPCILIRLGEAMLNYAEAKAELGTITQADLDISINKLRDRVGMVHMDLNDIPVDPRYVDDGVSPLIVEIRRERRIELAFEGFRYDDLRRWKQGKKLATPSFGIRWDEANRAIIDPSYQATVQTSLINEIPYVHVYKGSARENPVFDESKHYLWPIQRTAIAQNPKIGQNPGWE